MCAFPVEIESRKSGDMNENNYVKRKPRVVHRIFVLIRSLYYVNSIRAIYFRRNRFKRTTKKKKKRLEGIGRKALRSRAVGTAIKREEDACE